MRSRARIGHSTPWGNNRVASPACDLWHWNYSADPRGGGSGRVANAVFYDSPAIANTSLHISWSPETVVGDLHKNRAASLVYNDGTIRAMVGGAKNSAGASENSVGLLGKVAALSLMGMYNVSKSASGSKAKVTTFGATYDLGAGGSELHELRLPRCAAPIRIKHRASPKRHWPSRAAVPTVDLLQPD